MLTFADVIEGLSGTRPADVAQSIRHVVIDSREAGRGDLFVAFVGENADGHQYVADAFRRGAIAAVIEQDLPAIDAATIDLRSDRSTQSIGPAALPGLLRVDKTLTALQELAQWWRARFEHLGVIGITGSVGKSSTKELIAAVLQRDFIVLKSEGNLNNEIGLPLTLLQLEARHERAVLEMGTYGAGEITRLAELARPIIGVVTLVGPGPLGRRKSIDAIADAKSELVQALPANGVAILNYDDSRGRSMAAKKRGGGLTDWLDSAAGLWAGGGG